MPEVTVGSSAQCDINIANDFVSRRHCKLIYSSDGIWIEDLDSSNGTYVDGKQIRPETQVQVGPSSEVSLAREVTLTWDTIRSFRPDRTSGEERKGTEGRKPQRQQTPDGRRKSPERKTPGTPVATAIRFTGHFGHFFIVTLGLLLLSVVTLGLASPYLYYWTTRYFFTNLEIGERPVEFTGGFWEHFLISLGLFLLSVITLGLALPYYGYWNTKYFASNLQVRNPRTNIRFTGHFGHFFIVMLGLLLLSIVTLGLALPYLSYWTTRYFFTNLEIGERPVEFTGGFWKYFLILLGLLLLSVVTIGLALPYLWYWNVKYFASNLQVGER